MKQNTLLRLIKTLAVSAALLPVISYAQSAWPNAAIQRTDGLIIKYKDAKSFVLDLKTTEAPRYAERLARLQRSAGLKGVTLIHKRHTQFGASLLAIGSEVDLQEATKLAAKLAAGDPEIEYAVPDRRIELASTPNDPLFSQQWNLQDTNAGVSAAAGYDWTDFRSNTDPDKPIVAIIDTGYRPHVDLQPPYSGIDTVAGTSSALDTGDSCTSPSITSSWHGTKVQGIISGVVNNSAGIASVAGGAADIWQARVFGPCGYATLSNYVDAINAAVMFRSQYNQRVRVINLSQGGVDTPCDIPLQQAVTNATANGVLVVASAGNGARMVTSSGQQEQVGIDASRSSPGNCTGAMSIAATDRYGQKTQYSNYGPVVALSAPGGDNRIGTVQQDRLKSTSHAATGIDSSAATSSYYDYETAGTSFSAPHVSAAAALIFSKNPGLSVEFVKQILTSTAKAFPGVCNGCGTGILDVGAALMNTPRPYIIPPRCQINPRACA